MPWAPFRLSISFLFCRFSSIFKMLENQEDVRICLWKNKKHRHYSARNLRSMRLSQCRDGQSYREKLLLEQGHLPQSSVHQTCTWGHRDFENAAHPSLVVHVVTLVNILSAEAKVTDLNVDLLFIKFSRAAQLVFWFVLFFVWGFFIFPNMMFLLSSILKLKSI